MLYNQSQIAYEKTTKNKSQNHNIFPSYIFIYERKK